jgi:hypothetical protein
MLDKYNAMLTAIRDLCSTAHIAGGAVRDTLLGKKIKDVDLFLDHGVGRATADEAAKLLRSRFGYVKTGAWVQYEGFSDPAVVCVARFEKADEDVPVCLIALNRPYDMQMNIRRFDFGVCMAAWDGINVYTAPRYRNDVEAKVFTLCRADNLAQFSYSMSRFTKLTAERYEGWELRVPREFERLAREHTFRTEWYRDDDTDEWCRKDGFEGKQTMRPKIAWPDKQSPRPKGGMAEGTW